MNKSELLILAIIIVGLAVLNVPIYVAILSGTVYLQIFVNDISLAGTFNTMVESISKSSLLCIPFFILVGNFMQSSTLGKRLIDLFSTILKNIRGGLSIAALISNAFFGAISGSSPAAVATFSPILYKPLEEKYGWKMSLGLLTSSGALSIIIPPSITLIVYAAATNQSVAKLFMAGFLPGILIVVLVCGYLVIKAPPVEKNEGKDRGKSEIGEALKKGLPVLVLPIIILGGIYGGIFTPTESAAVAAIYAAVISLILKDIKIRDIPKIIGASSKTIGQLMIIIASSIAFAQAATIAQLPAAVSTLFVDMGKIEFLLLLNIVLLIVGCFFETSSAVLLLSPLILPTALSLGIDPVHLGLIFTVNLSIGMFTPPFGLNIFVAQGVLGKSIGEISKSVVPFIVLYIVAVLIITYIPSISLLLPDLLL